eukprot:gene3734-6264_t
MDGGVGVQRVQADQLPLNQGEDDSSLLEVPIGSTESNIYSALENLSLSIVDEATEEEPIFKLHPCHPFLLHKSNNEANIHRESPFTVVAMQSQQASMFKTEAATHNNQQFHTQRISNPSSTHMHGNPITSYNIDSQNYSRQPDYFRPHDGSERNPISSSNHASTKYSRSHANLGPSLGSAFAPVENFPYSQSLGNNNIWLESRDDTHYHRNGSNMSQLWQSEEYIPSQFSGPGHSYSHETYHPQSKMSGHVSYPSREEENHANSFFPSHDISQQHTPQRQTNYMHDGSTLLTRKYMLQHAQTANRSNPPTSSFNSGYSHVSHKHPSHEEGNSDWASRTSTHTKFNESLITGESSSSSAMTLAWAWPTSSLSSESFPIEPSTNKPLSTSQNSSNIFYNPPQSLDQWQFDNNSSDYFNGQSEEVCTGSSTRETTRSGSPPLPFFNESMTLDLDSLNNHLSATLASGSTSYNAGYRQDAAIRNHSIPSHFSSQARLSNQSQTHDVQGKMRSYSQAARGSEVMSTSDSSIPSPPSPTIAMSTEASIRYSQNITPQQNHRLQNQQQQYQAAQLHRQHSQHAQNQHRHSHWDSLSASQKAQGSHKQHSQASSTSGSFGHHASVGRSHSRNKSNHDHVSSIDTIVQPSASNGQCQLSNSSSLQQRYVFIDNGNIFVGAQSLANGTMDLAIRLNVRVFSDLIEEKMPCVSREVAASRPSNPQICNAWRKINYSVFNDARNQTAHQIVTGRIASIVRGSVEPHTLVLATGDGSQYPDLAATAASKGWKVIVWSWNRCLSDKFRKLQSRFSDNVEIRALDTFRGQITFMANGRREIVPANYTFGDTTRSTRSNNVNSQQEQLVSSQENEQ